MKIDDIIDNTQKEQTRILNNCELCDKSYSFKFQLRNHHNTIHLGIRFKCSKCANVFTEKKKCQAHVLKVHDVLENIVIEEIKVAKEQRKQYKCGECPAILFSTSGLQQHIYVKHQGKRYNCLECGQLFPTKQKCKSHVSNFHGTFDQKLDEGFIVIVLKNEDDCSKCDICKATFFMPDELANHIKRKHPKLFLFA